VHGVTAAIMMVRVVVMAVIRRVNTARRRTALVV